MGYPRHGDHHDLDELEAIRHERSLQGEAGRRARSIYRLLVDSGHTEYPTPAAVVLALFRLGLVHARVNDLGPMASLMFRMEQKWVEEHYGTTIKEVLDPKPRQLFLTPPPAGPVPDAQERWER